MYPVRLRRPVIPGALALVLAHPVLGQQRLTPAEAAAHIGEQATACGTVVCRGQD